MEIKNKTHKLQKTNLTNLFSEQDKIDNKKITNKSLINKKNFPASNMIWTNNLYNYNKVNERDIPFVNNISEKFIQKLFNLNYLPREKFIKSKRMRDLIRRKSENKIFFAKPEIKLINDKVIINAYTYDRTKLDYIKNFFFFRHYKNYNSIKKNLTSVFNNKDKTGYIDDLYKNITCWKKNLFFKFYKRKQYISQPITNKTKKLNRYSSWLYDNFIVSSNLKKKLDSITITSLGKRKLWNYKNFINYKGIMRFKHLKKYMKLKFFINCRRYKKYQIKNLLSYRYFLKRMKYSFHLKKTYSWRSKYIKFRIKRRILSRKLTKYRLNNIKINNLNRNYIYNIYIVYLIKSLLFLGVKINIFKNKIYIKYPLLYKKIHIEPNTLSKKNLLNLSNLDYHKHKNLVIHINKFDKIKDNIIIYMLKTILDKLLNSLLNKHSINFFKKLSFRKLIKSRLESIKKNSINLKVLNKFYINQLKFNKRLPSIKNILERLYNKKIQLNLIKLKYIQLNTQNLIQLISLKVNKKKSRILRVLKKSLKSAKLPLKIDLEKKNKYNNNIKKIFTNVNYKWISGMTIEAKGRLTKRFTAARALFKLKRKGNLKNLEARKLVKNTWINPSISMVRNNIKPNIQYKQKQGKKRIGAFGLKGWISSN